MNQTQGQSTRQLFMQGVALFIFLLICFVVGGFGSVFTLSSLSTWYAALHKPAWNPPDWVFAPVWNMLFLMMGVAGWIVWKERQKRPVRQALFLFAIQLALNLCWSIIFFGLRNPGLAFLEILLLWTAILLTMMKFWRIQHVAGFLFLPYLLWVTFAISLNLFLWRLNV